MKSAENAIQFRTTGNSGRRRGFLLVDTLGGTALAVIALGMTLWVLTADMKLRRQNELARHALLTAENVLERLDLLGFDELQQAKADQVAAEYLKQAGVPGLDVRLNVEDKSGEMKFKRVMVNAGVNEKRVRIWRDRYPAGGVK